MEQAPQAVGTAPSCQSSGSIAIPFPAIGVGFWAPNPTTEPCSARSTLCQGKDSLRNSIYPKPSPGLRGQKTTIRISDTTGMVTAATPEHLGDEKQKSNPKQSCAFLQTTWAGGGEVPRLRAGTAHSRGQHRGVPIFYAPRHVLGVPPRPIKKSELGQGGRAQRRACPTQLKEKAEQNSGRSRQQ